MLLVLPHRRIPRQSHQAGLRVVNRADNPLRKALVDGKAEEQVEVPLEHGAISASCSRECPQSRLRICRRATQS